MPGPKPNSAYMDFVEKYRAWLVCFGVLPASTVLKLVEQCQRWLTAPKASEHDARVARVCAAVKQWASVPEAERKLMCTDRSSSHSHSVRLTDKEHWHKIKMGDLRAIIDVDAAAGTVHVEPGVTVKEITLYLLERGLQLECTLEMEDATLGGLAAATGVTTHSHVCGLIHDTIVSWEVVTASGDALHVTKDNEHAELFTALPFSHGSLGLVVGLTMRVVPAKPFVRLTYTPYESRDAFIKAYEYAMRGGYGRESDKGEDTGAPFYCEAILFSPERAVLMEGRLVDGPAADAPLNPIGRWWKPWFYTRVREVLSGVGGGGSNGSSAGGGDGSGRGAAQHDTIPMYDFLMRHDRSMCMTMEVHARGTTRLRRLAARLSTLVECCPPLVSLTHAAAPDRARSPLSAARRR